jgi:hypothetical protein
MPFYKITRTDRIDYGEFYGMVVRAASRAEALKVVTERDAYDDDATFPGTYSGVAADGSNLKVERVRDGKTTRVILTDWASE